MKFRLFHLILEVCRYSTALLPVLASRVRIRCGYYPGIFLEKSSIVPSLLLIWFYDALISVQGIGYLSSWDHLPILIFCVSIPLPIHRVCVTTGIVQTVSLPVSANVCYRMLSQHNHYPWLRSGRSSCSPTFRGSVILKRNSSWREVGLLVRWRR